MNQTESEYDKEKFCERLAKLTGGVAIIRVGGATEAEMKQTKGRVEDALHATRAAVAEGIVPGGGTALLRCIPTVEDAGRETRRRRAARCRDRRPGAGEAGPHHCRELRRGWRGHRRRESRLGARRRPNIGYNANTGEYVDMFKAGIVDPTQVTRSALTNAASIAGLMLTTEVMITKIDEDEPGNKVAGSIR